MYIKKIERIFSKEKTYAEGLLKYLLREIFEIYYEKRDKNKFILNKREKYNNKKIKDTSKQRIINYR